MKRNVLAVVIPALLAAGAANAAEIYNKDGNKVDVYGKVVGLHYFVTNSDGGEDVDKSYARLGFKGETQISDQLTGYGQWEAEFKAATEGGSTANTRLSFVGFKFGDLGSFDYGRNVGIAQDVASFTDVLVEFGGTYADSDVYMTKRASALATYRNSGFFGLVDGLNVALQYQGKTDGGQANEGYSVATTYDIMDTGVAVGASYTASHTIDGDVALGDKAEVWNFATKYDANNVYLAAMFAETRNVAGWNKTQNIELAAQYQFDFGLRPSLGYVQQRAKEENKNYDLIRHVEVGAFYDFNKNMSAYVAYQINMLDKKDDPYAKSTDDILATGLVYQF
ncbi:porin [Serratia microhaemolytica]|uniref:porin n=1 Tax=Serratia microhaemolytica TaxID=2675110 RepID=UPI000FDEA961